MNDKSNKAALKLELTTWIRNKVKKGKFESELAAREYLSIDVMGCSTVKSFENILYLQVWPMKTDHALALNKATKINLAVLKPSLWGKRK